jgi:hypothetical protein
VNPDDLPHLLREIRLGRVRLEDALREVHRKLQEDPGCRTANTLLRRLESARTLSSY